MLENRQLTHEHLASYQPLEEGGFQKNLRVYSPTVGDAWGSW